MVEKKIALAVDASMHSVQAVRYAGRMADRIPGVRYVLVHIQPTISEYLLEEAQKSLRANRVLKRMIEKNKTAAQAMLDKYRDQLVQQGMAAESIEVFTQPRLSGVADDLLALSQAAAYDALLVGRRGVSYLQELVMGSVTANLLNNSRLTPVWVVDDEVHSNRILLAVDGSQKALRAVDHLAFILCGHPEARIHMLHVQPRLQDYCEIGDFSEQVSEAETIVLESDRRCLDDFYAQAVSILKNHGFEETRIALDSVSNRFFAGRSILEEARNGGYGTIVMGRRGISKSRFFGSVSRHVLQKSRNLAVWIVP